MKYPILYIATLVALCFKLSYGQEYGKPFITNYSSKDYKGHTQNWTIEQDSNGIVYFGNQAGVLTYDGSSWRTIKIDNHSTVRSLGKDANGTIYVGAVGEFGYLESTATGKIKYHSLKTLLDSSLYGFSNVWNIAAFNDKVYYLTDNYLFVYDGAEITYYKPKGAYFYSCFSTPYDLFVHDFEHGLTTLKGDSLVLIPNGEELFIESIHAIMPIDENKVMLATREKGLIEVDYNIGKFDLMNIDLRWYVKEKQLYHVAQLDENTYAIATIQNGVIIVDKFGKFLEVINKKSGLVDETVYCLYADNGVLWCALEKGIAKIEYNRTYRYWDETNGLQGSITDIQRFDDKVFVSTGGGIFTMKTDTLVETTHFKRAEQVLTQTWDILPFKNDLLIATGRGLLKYSDGDYELLYRGRGIYKLFVSEHIKNRIYMGQLNQLSYIDYDEQSKKFSEPTLIKVFNRELRDLIEDSKGNLWVGINYNGVAKINYQESIDSSFYTTEVFQKQKRFAIERQVRFFKYENDILFASDLGLFRFNYNNNSFYRDTAFLKKFNIKDDKELIISKYNNTYCISGKYLYKETTEGVIKDSLTLKRFPELSVELQYSENEITTWIGTSDGLFKINDSFEQSSPDKFKAIIRQVLTKNDSTLYWGTKELPYQIKIDHHTNFIGFHFSSPFFIMDNNVQYSYFLDGYDDDWSDWSYENKKEFTNLFEGKYTFKVKAKNYLDQESEIDEFEFIILPPIYRTLWAYLLYAVIFMAVVSLAVYYRTRMLRLDKIKLERVVHARTQEIVNQKNKIEIVAKQLSDANQELKKLSLIARKSDNAVVVFDKEGNIQWINEGFTRMYGYTIDQFINERGKNLLEASDNPNITTAIKNCIETKETTIYQYFALTRDNQGIWAQTTLTPLLDKSGNLQQLIAIDTDITKLKDAEQQIENQRDELIKANQNKDKLFSIIAHDLRGPLSNIFTMLNIVHQDIDMFDKEEIKDMIAQLRETTGNTFNLTENLLDWAHLRRDTINYNPRTINLKDLVQENIELFNSQANKKEIELISVFEEEEHVFADEEMVKTILRNLISNAIKFTNKSGKVSLATSLEGNKRLVHVSDTGKGMEQWEIDRLFKIEQPHSTLGTEKEKGSGLGLILAKEFVEKNHGEIRVESTKGKGSTFSFSLPLGEL